MIDVATLDQSSSRNRALLLARASALLEAWADRLDRLVAAAQARLDAAEAFAARTNDTLDTLTAAGQALAGRVATIENAAVSLTVVANAGALPASAPPRNFYRVQGDPALYIGNGSGQPLGKLTPA